MSKSILILFLFVAVALSGCADDTSNQPISTSSSSSESTSSSSTSSSASSTTSPSTSSTSTSSAPPKNKAPVIASFTATKLVLTTGESTVFDFTGSDPEGDTITWKVDANGDGTPEKEGTTLPGTYNHTFADAGNYTATLTLSDGKNTSTAQVGIVVSAPSGPMLPITYTFTGTTTDVCDPVLGAVCATDEVLDFPFGVPAGATNIAMTLTWDVVIFDIDLYGKDPAGNTFGQSAHASCPTEVPDPLGIGICGGLGTESFSAAISSEGIYIGRVIPFQAVMADFTLVVTVS